MAIPLIDKIASAMKGFPNNPDFFLLNKSDKEVAAFFKGLVSRYLTESKQQLIEAEITSYVINPVEILGPYPTANVRLVEMAMDKYGITNSYTRISILSVIAKESKFKPQSENSYANNNASYIKKVFNNNRIYINIDDIKKGTRVIDLSDAQINKLKSNDEKFFNALYGGRYNTPADEGYKYRGRGFNQLTFKSAYIKAGKRIGLNLVGNPDLVNKPAIAAMVSVTFLKNRLREKFGASLGNLKIKNKQI